MRIHRTNEQRNAARKAIIDQRKGFFSLLRLYTRFQLIITFLSLVLSLILLFNSTYAYYQFQIENQKQYQPNHNANHLDRDRTDEIVRYHRNIMNLYGINETDFEMFFKSKPSSTLELSVAKQRSKSESIQISKTLHHLYQYQTSMVFVAVVSIFIEVGLIYSIIVENFKLTVLYNVIMIAGLVFHLAGTEREIQNDAELNRSYRSFSFIYQTLFLCTFLVYTVGLKIRNYKADRLLRKNQIELIAKHKYSP